LTYTYCRFELTQLLQTVFIVDFDEFLFCPKVNLSISAQASEVRQMVENTQLKGYESVTMQRSAIGYLSSDFSSICSKLANAKFKEVSMLPGGILSCFQRFE